MGTRIGLGVDFGTTHTVATVVLSDGRAQPLLFDSNPLMASAVFVDDHGRLLVGRDAERNARLDPARYEPNPKRRVDEGSLLLGTHEFRVEDLFAAVLSRVAFEANRVAAGRPPGVALTYPAKWGATRQRVLLEAANRAGLTAVTLVPEPVAAAAYFTSVLGRHVPPGSALVVYDFGGGTFDTAVVARRPDLGWDVLVNEGHDSIGGLDLDATIIDRIEATVGRDDPERWRRLRNPGTPGEQRDSRSLWTDVQAAKEQLSRTASAVVHVPSFDVDVHVTREEFEQGVRPMLQHTVELTANAIGTARLHPQQIAGIFLVGGSSRIPLVNTLLHQRFGVAPTIIEQPELVVSQGSLSAFAAGPGGPAVPPGAPLPGPPIPAPPIPGAPMSGAPMSGAPMSGAPMSGVPMSGVPVSGSPTSGAPVSGAPGSPATAGAFGAPLPPPGPRPPAGPFGPPPPGPAGAPSGGIGDPPPDRTSGRGGRFLAIVAGAVVLVLLLCGVGGTTLWKNLSSEEKDPGAENVADDQPTDIVVEVPGAGGEPSPVATGAPQQSVTVGKAAWFAGLKVTVQSAAYEKAEYDSKVTVATVIENPSRSDAYLNVPITLSVDGQHYDGRAEGVTRVPSKASSETTFTFRVDEVNNLGTAMITLGDGDDLKSTIPFDASGQVVSNEPIDVLGATPVKFGDYSGTVKSCQVRADFFGDHRQVKDGKRSLACTLDLQYGEGGDSSTLFNAECVRLMQPNGNAIAAEEPPNELYTPGEMVTDLVIRFDIPWPAPGGYELRLSDAYEAGDERAPNVQPVKIQIS